MNVEALAARLRGALHPLATPPVGDPWNLFELDGLLSPGQPQAAAVLVGVIPRDEGASVLLTRRNDALRNHGGQVSFPGGRMESGDASPLDAALREAAEEVGLPSSQVSALGYLDPLLTITGFRVQPVLVLVAPDFVAKPDPSEVADVFEVPMDWLLDPDQLERITLHFGGRARHVFQYRYQPQRIWGVTASILFNLRERLAPAPHGRT